MRGNRNGGCWNVLVVRRVLPPSLFFLASVENYHVVQTSAKQGMMSSNNLFLQSIKRVERDGRLRRPKNDAFRQALPVRSFSYRLWIVILHRLSAVSTVY